MKKILVFPFFLSTTMGLALSNTKAVYEGMINKKSAFIRTPKFVVSNDLSRKNKYASNNKISLLLFVEIIFALYSLTAVGFSVYYLELATLSFNLMFFLGFFSVATLSLKDVLIKK